MNRIPSRPAYNRPAFGAKKWMFDQYILLVAYESNHAWYYVPYNPQGVAGPDSPRRCVVAWNGLPDEQP